MGRLLVLALSLLCLTAPAQAQNAPPRGPQPVITAPAKLDRFTDSVEALGTLRANETVTLTSTVTETVTAINFEDGQRVEAGDILVEMMSAQEAAELDAEQATVDEARAQTARLEPLIKSGAASKASLDERRRDLETALARLEAVKSRMADRIITAPFAGVVGLRNLSVGTVLQPGTRITTLDDDSVMKLDFSVPSVFLPALKEGIDIAAVSNAFPGRVFRGKISSIDSQVDAVTRSIAVRALIPNSDGALRPGLLMSVEILKNPREAIVIPEAAVVPEARRNFVFVVEAGKARKREVMLGARRPGDVEVLGGLVAGEQVVTHGTLNITDGAAVQITAQDTGDAPVADLIREKKKDGEGKGE